MAAPRSANNLICSFTILGSSNIIKKFSLTVIDIFSFFLVLQQEGGKGENERGKMNQVNGKGRMKERMQGIEEAEVRDRALKKWCLKNRNIFYKSSI